MNWPVEPDREKIKLYIPTATFIKIGVAVLLAAAIIKLAPLFALMAISVILAVSAEPFLKKCEKRWTGRFGRKAAITFIGLVVLGCGLFIVFEVIPPLANQLSIVASKLPAYLQKHLNRFTYGPQVYVEIEKHFRDQAAAWMASILTAGVMVLESLSSLLLVYVLFLYFMVDGERAYNWICAFFQPSTREKIDTTSTEVSDVISAYVLGQVITSALAAAYVFIVLRLLGVPAALTLAVLAAIFDALPVLGFFLSLIPAVIFALTVSPDTALMVVGAYILYHLIENYLVCPFVYGNRMRMSGLVVLVSFLVGGLLAGLPGALLVLPVAASYPIIERIWLRHVVQLSTLKDHAVDTE